MKRESSGQFVLLVDHDGGFPLLDCETFGPFPTLVQAQAFAEEFRKEVGLPMEATNENNDYWTDRGWTFAIKEMLR